MELKQYLSNTGIKQANIAKEPDVSKQTPSPAGRRKKDAVPETCPDYRASQAKCRNLQILVRLTKRIKKRDSWRQR